MVHVLLWLVVVLIEIWVFLLIMLSCHCCCYHAAKPKLMSERSSDRLLVKSVCLVKYARELFCPGISDMLTCHSCQDSSCENFIIQSQRKSQHSPKSRNSVTTKESLQPKSTEVSCSRVFLEFILYFVLVAYNFRIRSSIYNSSLICF